MQYNKQIINKLKKENEKKIATKIIKIFFIWCLIINILAQQERSSATGWNTQLFKSVLSHLDEFSQNVIDKYVPVETAKILKPTVDLMVEPIMLMIIQKILNGGTSISFTVSDFTSTILAFHKQPVSQGKFGQMGGLVDGAFDMITSAMTGTTKNTKIHNELRRIMANLVTCMWVLVLSNIYNLLPLFYKETSLFRISLKNEHQLTLKNKNTLDKYFKNSGL